MIPEFTLLIFTLLTGIASSVYLAAAIFPEQETGKRPWLLPFVMLVLLVVGSACVIGHLGRPDRMLNAFANPLSSGISQEGIMAAILGIITTVDVAIAIVRKTRLRVVAIIGSIAAILLGLAMSNAYYTMYSVPALHSLGTWMLFLAGNFAMGFALYGAIVPEAYTSKTFCRTSAALAAITGIGIIALAAGFANAKIDFALLAAGAIIGSLGSSLAILLGTKFTPQTQGALVLTLSVVGFAIARYGFYAVIPG